MANVRKERKFGTPAGEMWERIGDFQALHTWLPGIESSESIDGGSRRKLAVGGGAHIIERLLEESEMSHRYTIDEGPLPISDYVSTLSVRDEDGGCVVTWEATFEPAGIPEEQAVAMIDGLYETGLANLDK